MIPHVELREGDGAGARVRRWGLAAVFIVGLHAAAAALAMTHWPEEDTSTDPAGSFLVELAPAPVAPPAEKLNLAIGQRSEEAAPAVTPTEEIKEKSEVETPKLEPTPAPDPDVALPKPQPVEKEDEKAEEEDPRPKQEAVPTVSAAAQETSAPPPVEAPPAPVAAAPKAGFSAKPSEAAMSWQKSLVHHLNHHKKYPKDARKRGEQGVANVSFTIDRSGKVISAKLETSSGSELLDEEALAVLDRASPLPAPPSEMPNLTIDLLLPIQFRIRQ